MRLLSPGRLFWLMQQSFREFRLNEPLRMAASTAFFSTFALPPIILILVQTIGLFLNRRTVARQMFEKLSSTLGQNTVLQIRDTLRSVRHMSGTWYITVGGSVFLLFVATTLFGVIKDSLNQLWRMQIREKMNILIILQYRAKSVGIIMITGLLFIIVMFGEAAGALLQQYLGGFFPVGAGYLNSFINKVLSVVVIVAWFTLIFRFLSDGRPHWKIAIVGGVFTGLLFTVGKYLLAYLLVHSNMQTIYGASASFVLLLLFVFYVAFMFYFGACFTKVYGDYLKLPIRPSPHAVQYAIQRIEMKENVDGEEVSGMHRN
jgi:membrane protein